MSDQPKAQDVNPFDDPPNSGIPKATAFIPRIIWQAAVSACR